MSYGISFRNKHSYRDFGLRVISRSIRSPSKIKKKERIPFSNVVYDFSSILGDQEYEERISSYTFEILNYSSRENIEIFYTKVVNWLYGSENKDILIDDWLPNFYFRSEVESGTFPDSFKYGNVFTIEFVSYPFMISVLPEGHDIWDEFNFELDVAQIPEFEVNGSREVTLYNAGASSVVPTIKTSSEFTIEIGTISVTVSAGTHKSELIRLRKGENKITIIGNGTIEFDFYKELI